MDVLAPLLSSQLTRSNPDASPAERRLLVAVLNAALADYQKYEAARDAKKRRWFTDVEHWFMSDDTDWPFSFVRVCDGLGLDVASIRAGVRRGFTSRPPASHPPD